MTEQITLLDVCKLPDVQIHSKTAFFKHIVERQNAQMLKLRQNIVKLSYTNKIIGVKGDQVGIISKRLPLKFKQSKIDDNKNDIKEFYLQDTGYISHKNFFVQPLPTVRKSQSKSKQENKIDEKKYKTIKIEQHLDSITTMSKFNFQTVQPSLKYPLEGSNKGLRARTHSTARLKIPQKKPKTQDFTIQRTVQRNARLLQGNKKSFSNLLKDIKVINPNNNLIVSPIMHEENTLFKRYQRLINMERQEKQNEQQNLLSNDY